MTWFLAPAARARLTESGSPVSVGTQKEIKINLCSGSTKLEGFINIDLQKGADRVIDLERDLLPFPDGTVDSVICISAINYFSYERGQEIIQDVYRVLRPGGVARFAVQDLRVLAEKYLSQDHAFYFQKLPNGRDRFPGRTYADKFNEFFTGFSSGDKHCKYVYDFDSLSTHFRSAGFACIEQKAYRESRIEGAEIFDNRPEQMFFLEAVKDDRSGGTNPDDGACMSERGWQALLIALERDPGDRTAVLAAADVLKARQRQADLHKLLSGYLARHPADHAIRMLAEQACDKANRDHRNRQVAQAARRELHHLDNRVNAVGPDLDHLAGCMKWLSHAHGINPGGGVAAMYYMDRRCWDVDYPETTGYIIPTFLKYAQLTGDSTWTASAVRMGEWEIDIQQPGGGIGEPVGVFGLTPRVFNTSQVILGWVSLFRHSGDQRFLEAARKAADWVLASQDGDGKWIRNTYSGKPKSYKSRVAWALMELFAATSEERYRAAAESAVAWIMTQARSNGWFANASLTHPDHPWTHLIGYVLVGLLETVRIGDPHIRREEVLGLLHNAGQRIARVYLKSKSEGNGGGRFATLPGTLGPDWSGPADWSCTTGNAQIAFFLRRLAELSPDGLLLTTAAELQADLKRIHLLDGIDDPAMCGGLPGAYPLGGPYCSYAIPNWGVKFFADALLQTIAPLGDHSCLG